MKASNYPRKWRFWFHPLHAISPQNQTKPNQKLKQKKKKLSHRLCIDVQKGGETRGGTEDSLSERWAKCGLEI